MIYLDTSVVLAQSSPRTSIEYLREERLDLRLATYDERMSEAARRMKIPLLALPA